jgi:hypothetical protein
MIGYVEQNVLEEHIQTSFTIIKKQNPLLILEPREYKIYKMYERDMNIITDSLLHFASINPNIESKMKKMLGDETDPDIQTNKLNLILYKNSLNKIK